MNNNKYSSLLIGGSPFSAWEADSDDSYRTVANYSYASDCWTHLSVFFILFQHLIPFACKMNLILFVLV